MMRSCSSTPHDEKVELKRKRVRTCAFERFSHQYCKRAHAPTKVSTGQRALVLSSNKT